MKYALKSRMFPWILLGLAVVSWVVVTLVVHKVIGDMYRGESLPALNGLMENRAEHPLEYYTAAVDRLVLGGYFLVGMAAPLLYLRRFRSPGIMLTALLAGDAIFGIFSEIYGGLFDIRLDGGIPEFYQYLKEGTLAVVFYRLFQTRGEQIYLGFSGLFAFFLLDDALKYHERMGTLLVNVPGVTALAHSLGVRPNDIGELVSVGPPLALILAFLILPYVRTTPDVRRHARRMVYLVGCLAVFGAVLDIVDRMFMGSHPDTALVLSFLEDLGEMVVMSALLAYALWIKWGTVSASGRGAWVTKDPMPFSDPEMPRFAPGLRAPTLRPNPTGQMNAPR